MTKEKIGSSIANLTNARSAFDLIVPSFEGFKVNWQLISLVVLIPAALQVYVVESLTVTALQTETPDFSKFFADNPQLLPFAYISLAVGFAAYCMQIHLALKSALKEKTTIGESLRTGLRFALRLFALSVLMSLALLLGLLLFIIPGIIVFKMFMLAPYYLYAENLGPIEAMKRSARDTKGENRMLIWGVIGVTLLLMIATSFLGIIPILGSLIATLVIAVYNIAYPIRYYQIRELKKTAALDKQHKTAA